jgi:predicted Fe-Mo cluster-binding NifX family protein
MKVALTYWDGRIAPVFDVSRRALILTIEDGVVTSRHTTSIEAPSVALKIGRLVELGIGTLICGAISEPLHRELTSRGVKVLGFVAGEVGEVEENFLAGALPSTALSMPGCCGGRRRFRGGCGGARGGGWGRNRHG